MFRSQREQTEISNVWQYVVYDAFGKCVAEYGQLSDGVGGVKYVQQDWQGSVRTVTNANGFVVSRTDHQAFGGEVGYGTGQRSIEQGYNTDPATRQSYGLTERDDATGLDHTWFRKNESSAGRWTSPDPYNGSMFVGDPQSFNRYSYVTSDPVNSVDPTGLLLVVVRCTAVRTRIYSEDGKTIVAEWTDYENCSQTFVGIGGGAGGSVWSIDGVDAGGGGDAGTTKPWQGGGGGRQGECERIAAQIQKKMDEFDRELAKYNPIADYYGLQGYMRKGSIWATTQPRSHYQDLLNRRHGINKKIEEWKRTCNDKFGSPPLVPLPAGAEESGERHIPEPRPISLRDILGAPPTTKQVEEWYKSSPVVIPSFRRWRIPVFR